ncbi:MAG: peptide/nickel transport system substrate-binding protein [Gaiellaceae bacterium]|nr:peptide/nickel transport system substrate-binding protein [Gaiellaceae bacterium]
MRSWCNRKQFLLLGACAAIVTAAGAAAAGAHSLKSGAGDIPKLTWALGASVRGLEYTHSADSGSATVISVGCETLVRFDKNGGLQPALADQFSTPNSTTYVYHLRKGVKFWDGHALTPADVLYSLQQAASKTGGSQIASFFSSVSSMKATGRTITIKLSAPDPYFRYTPAITYILEKAFWQKNGKDVGTPGTLTMCTGPYRFTKFVPDDRVEATRFNGYWGKRPAVKDIVLRTITNDATRLLAMRSGEIDGSFRISQDQIDQWKQLSGTSIKLAPELRTAYLSLDTSSAPWDDVHVRRAVAYALDKNGLVKSVLRGYGQPAPVMPPPEQWGDVGTQKYVQKLYKSFPKYTFSIAKAKAELAKSKYPNGFTAPLPYPDSQQTLGKAALSLAQNLKQIGITLDVKQITTDAWFGALFAHKDLGAQIISWGVDYPDPADALHFIYDSQYATANAFNTANYKNDKMDRLLKVQQNSVVAKVRADAIANALKFTAQDVPYIPIWYQQVAMALKSKYSYDFGTWYLYTPWVAGITAK